jgi:thiol-disulfide isomerase/thioredoxin
MTPNIYWGAMFTILLVTGIRWLWMGYKPPMSEEEGFLESRSPEGVNGLLTIYKVNWCPHCKRLTPMVDKLRERLRDHPIPGFSLEVVDCEEDRRLCREAGIRSYPTLLVSREGKSPFPLPAHVDRSSVDSVYQYLASLVA